MRKLWLPLLLLVFVVACEGTPTGPTDTDDDQNQTTNVIISIGGDDDHSGKGDGGDDGDNGGDVNSPPFIINPGAQTNSVGDTVSLVITAVDADGDDLDFTWVVNSAPRNLGLAKTGPNSALITGVISSSSAVDSPFATTIIVRDAESEGSTTFTWTINAAAVTP